jgi:hypothetical protein
MQVSGQFRDCAALLQDKQQPVTFLLEAAAPGIEIRYLGLPDLSLLAILTEVP